jgi:hypothetical protein
MKRTSNSLFTQLSNTAMESLTNVVKETLATVSVQSKTHRPFTTADLWSIQRQGRSRTTRRFL